MEQKIYDLKYIANECGKRPGSILAFIKYRLEENKPVPAPIPYQKSYYLYSLESANEIIRLFKEKKRGDMAKYNYEHNWGITYRKKHSKANKNK